MDYNEEEQPAVKEPTCPRCGRRSYDPVCPVCNTPIVTKTPDDDDEYDRRERR